jgi:hypothetical protein
MSAMATELVTGRSATATAMELATDRSVTG